MAHRLRAWVECQQLGVSRTLAVGRLHIPLCDAQIGAAQKPLDAGKRIALGLAKREQLGERDGLSGGLQQPIFQSLGDKGQRTKCRGIHAAKPV